jgi:hypothetical protein
VWLFEHPFFDLIGRNQIFFGDLWWNGDYQLDEGLDNKVSSCFCLGF